MNTALWIVQILLALVYLAAGIAKTTQHKDRLSDRMAWVDDFSAGSVRGIGVLELLGAIGLVLPGLLGILPWLTPLAAAGLALVQVGAAITHIRRGENQYLVMNFILFALAAFVAYGRFFVEPL
jgi:uncharacterized membrane protein YphA (DoxX/SURF4 family)